MAHRQRETIDQMNWVFEPTRRGDELLVPSLFHCSEILRWLSQLTLGA